MDNNNYNFDVEGNIERLYNQESLLDILIEFEGVMDSMDLYAFENWIEGEVVDGPKLERYWITVTLKYPYEKMPDPAGGNRLLKHGARIEMGKFTEDVPVRLKDYEAEEQDKAYEFDQETGQYQRKTEEQQYWLLEIRIPRRFIEDMEKGMAIYDDAEDEMVDVEDASAAENEGLDDEALISGDTDEEDMGEELDQF